MCHTLDMNSKREIPPRVHLIFCVRINSYFDIVFVCQRCVIKNKIKNSCTQVKRSV
jgi:hypothetical protein